MAEQEDASITSGESTAPLEKGTGEIPALTYGETGYNGLTVLGGNVFEECADELRWPKAATTYKNMAKDGAIAPALELVEMMVSRVPWHVSIPEGHEDELKDKAKYLTQVMGDMVHDWQTGIKHAATAHRYGFSVLEIVLRERRKEYGSKFDDGLVGIKKLAFRSQDSIEGWYWDSSGRNLAGLVQRINGPDSAATWNGWDFVNADPAIKNGGTKRIPRKKFLLFRNNPLKDSPTGTSALNGCWQAWKFKTSFQEAEAIGVAQDINGFKVLYLPPQYLQSNATEENKQAFASYQQAMNNMHVAKQSGIILPLIVDEFGNKMFEFDVMNVTGTKSYDTNEIINRYNAEILSSLFADFLTLGSNGGGSFSLAESKLTLIEMAIKYKLDEIKSQLNHQLVRTLFEQNGWETDVMPEFTYGDVSTESLTDISAFIQRVAAVGTFPRNRETINWVMQQAKIPYRVPDSTTQEELNEMLGQVTSRSGDGLSEGLPNGVGDSTGSGGDATVGNNANN